MSATYDLSIDQGADWAVQINWSDPAGNPFYVTAPIRMEIRTSEGQTLTALQSDDLGETTQDTIDYNSESGLIQLQLPSDTTSTFPAGVYQYDIFASYSDSQQVRLIRLLSGSVYVNGRITRNV